MNTNEIHEVMTETQQGRMVFPEVVRRLLAVGVESYFVDYACGTETFYATNGETHSQPMTLRFDGVAGEFSLEGVVAAIRGAQTDTIRYPEFARLATEAGVI